MSAAEGVVKERQPMASVASPSVSGGLMRSLSAQISEEFSSDSVLDIFGIPVLFGSFEDGADLLSQRWFRSSETQFKALEAQQPDKEAVSGAHESNPAVSNGVQSDVQNIVKQEVDSEEFTAPETSLQNDDTTEENVATVEKCMSMTSSQRPPDVRPKIFVHKKGQSCYKSQELGKSENKHCEGKVELCNNKKMASNDKIKTKKKKVRTKENKKWKPVDITEFGFEFPVVSRMSFDVDITRNELDLDSELMNAPETNCSQINPSGTFSDAELVTKGIDRVEEVPSLSADDSIVSGSSDDDAKYFLSLGIDVFAYHDDSEFDPSLDWDGVVLKGESKYSPTKVEKSSFKKQERSGQNKHVPTKNTPASPKKKKAEKDNTDIVPKYLHCSGPCIRGYIRKSDKYSLYELECSSKKRVYIRRDRHRRVEKAHKAVKSKNCVSIYNNRGRKRLYMHHRLVKMHNLNLDFRFSPKRWALSPKSKSTVDLKAAKEIFKVNHNTHDVVNNGSRQRSDAPVQNLRHTLHESNAPNHLDMDLASFLISIQHREMTPEDYDMLLRLDDTVKPKTVSENILENLKTDTVGPEGAVAYDDGILCTICMEPYVQGDRRKFLPCGHDFHASCVDTWLKNSSMNCPLDGLPVEAS